jgi:hypothetical protein
MLGIVFFWAFFVLLTSLSSAQNHLEARYSLPREIPGVGRAEPWPQKGIVRANGMGAKTPVNAPFEVAGVSRPIILKYGYFNMME